MNKVSNLDLDIICKPHFRHWWKCWNCWTQTTFGAPFAKLDQVQIGDELILTVDSKKFHYVVDEVRIVEAIGGEYVLYNRGDDN